MGVRLALASALFLASCGSDEGAYTLYRSSPTDSNMRVHVATFDAKEGAHYNRDNCQIAAELFGRQSGVVVKYWCEKGEYKK